MKNFLRYFLFACVAFSTQLAYANYLGINDTNLRNGDITFDDIPKAIISVTQFLLGLTGTIAVAVIVYGALRIALGAVPGDKDTGKKLVTSAIIGFIISVSGWVIINIFVSNF